MKFSQAAPGPAPGPPAPTPLDAPGLGPARMGPGPALLLRLAGLAPLRLSRRLRAPPLFPFPPSSDSESPQAPLVTDLAVRLPPLTRDSETSTRSHESLQHDTDPGDQRWNLMLVNPRAIFLKSKGFNLKW